MFAAALAVRLTGDGGVAAPGSPNSATRQDQIDCAQHVLHAMRMMLDAAGVQQEAGFGRAPHLGGLADRPLGDARDFCRPLRRPRFNVLGDLVKADGVTAR